MSYTTLFVDLGTAGYTGTLNDRMVAALRAATGNINGGYNTLLAEKLETTYSNGSFSLNFKAWKDAGFPATAILPV